MTAASSETHLSQSVAVSLGGYGDDDLLSPLLAEEEFQVLPDGLQPGEFRREVNGRHARMVAVPVQLFLQGLVDLVQRAQQELTGHNAVAHTCAEAFSATATLKSLEC